jgi:Rrf2 family transcriptional regulator, iron-sulfur cluster assembly transcription factor
MRFSARDQYAILGMFDLAYNGQDRAVRVREIGERQGVPNPYLEQIFQALRKAGLVRAKRGPQGGFTLARAPEEISLAQILTAVDGFEVAAAWPLEGETGHREYFPEFLGAMLAERFATMLSELTLKDLCSEAHRADLPSVRTDQRMYHI